MTNPNLNTPLTTALGRNKLRMCECMSITRVDGTVYRFTAHDQPLTVNGQTYTPADAFSISAMEYQSGLAVSNMDIEGIISSTLIKEEDIITGLFDGARVEILLVQWTTSANNVSIAVASQVIRRGSLGDITAGDATFQAEMRGLGSRLASTFVDALSLECRYVFGDTKCTFNRASVTHAITIATVNSSNIYTMNVNPTATNGLLRHGTITFTSGANNGRSYELVRHNDLRIVFMTAPLFTVNVGDTANVIEGCVKTYKRCLSLGNVLNFGGEPFITGTNVLGAYPDAKT